MIALLHQLPSETKILKTIRQARFGKNLCCPWCRSRQVYRSESRYRCRRCRRPFTLLSGTWLAGMKLSLRTWWALCWCWTQQIPVLQTQALCHVGDDTVRHWFRQFRLHCPPMDAILSGIVQMDEAYFRSVALVMAKQVGSTHVAWQVLAKGTVDQRDAATFLYHSIRPGTRLQTDGAAIYKTLHHWWPITHRVDLHKKFQFGLTSEIEGMLGKLRTFIRRMYHHVTAIYLAEYVTEFCVRFSSPELFTSPQAYLQSALTPVPFD